MSGVTGFLKAVARPVRVLTLAGLALLLAVSTAHAQTGDPVIATPAVSGPLPAVPPGDPSRNYPFDSSVVPVSRFGYEEHEYLFSGDTSVGAYTTRMLVRRPADPGRFSGRVIVEWANVSNHYDVDPLWDLSAEHIMRSGDAYVLVTAQTNGVYAPGTGLKAWNPERYGPLSLPQVGSFVAEPGSYEIFGQALRAMRSPAAVAPLAGLNVQHLIATGASQSATTMTIYAHDYGSRYGGVDGYLIWKLSSATLGGSPATSSSIPSPTGTDGPPVLWINTETDISRKRTTPDGPTYRLWEVAGTTHVSYDAFQWRAAIQRRDFGVDLKPPTCRYRPYSRIPTGSALDAGLEALRTWVADGTPPKKQPALRYDAKGNPVRDAYGNAVGGVRLPEQAVPTAQSSRVNSGRDPGCVLTAGRSVPFTAKVLRTLYPTHADYVAKFRRAAGAAVKAGVLLPEDARQSIRDAQASKVPAGP